MTKRIDLSAVTPEGAAIDRTFADKRRDVRITDAYRYELDADDLWHAIKQHASEGMSDQLPIAAGSCREDTEIFAAPDKVIYAGRTVGGVKWSDIKSR